MTAFRAANPSPTSWQMVNIWFQPSPAYLGALNTYIDYGSGVVAYVNTATRAHVVCIKAIWKKVSIVKKLATHLQEISQNNQTRNPRRLETSQVSNHHPLTQHTTPLRQALHHHAVIEFSQWKRLWVTKISRTEIHKTYRRYCSEAIGLRNLKFMFI